VIFLAVINGDIKTCKSSSSLRKFVWENVNISIDQRPVCVHAIGDACKFTMKRVTNRVHIAWTETSRHSILN